MISKFSLVLSLSVISGLSSPNFTRPVFASSPDPATAAHIRRYQPQGQGTSVSMNSLLAVARQEVCLETPTASCQMLNAIESRLDEGPRHCVPDPARSFAASGVSAALRQSLAEAGAVGDLEIIFMTNRFGVVRAYRSDIGVRQLLLFRIDHQSSQALLMTSSPYLTRTYAELGYPDHVSVCLARLMTQDLIQVVLHDYRLGRL